MMKQSPSSCTYCYELECEVRVESVSSGCRMSPVVCKNSVVTVGRNAFRQILVQISMSANRGGMPALMSYPLGDCRVHAKMSQGVASLELPSRQLLIQLRNCPPRKLNVFVKSLQAKIDLMHENEKSGQSCKTPSYSTRTALLEGLPEVFTNLSPLTITEIRKIRSMRGIVDTPPRKDSSPMTPKPNRMASKRPALGDLTNTPSRKLAKVEPNRCLTVLSEEQKEVVRVAVSQRQSVFFTGSAGTGKSLVLRRIIEMLPATTTHVTAATGVAACQLDGTTLHSFAGFGGADISSEACVAVVRSRKEALRRWKECTHLVIDEISMVDAAFFSKLEHVARAVREREEPFGGIQLIITGDFLQLPPVTKKDEGVQFCFESTAWDRCIRRRILLEEVRRQDDHNFVRMLQEIRFGRCSEETLKALQATRSRSWGDVVPTRLCTHTVDAGSVNVSCLEELPGETREFHAEDSAFIPMNTPTNAPRLLVLKLNAQVMLTKNMDLSKGLANGARGLVTGFSKLGFPLVRFLAYGTPLEVHVAPSSTLQIRPTRFSVRVPGVEPPVERRQLPLQLAWALSIHKAQGLTLDAVELSLARVFAEGQAYVALSRARSLSSIRVLSFDSSCVLANSRVVSFYESLKDDCPSHDFLIRRPSKSFF